MQFWIHPDGYLYTGDKITGAREATQEEINSILKPSPEEVQKALTDAIQSHLDKKANELGYDNIHAACTYAASTDEIFRAEALACVAWRDSVWRVCYNILDKVAEGLREIPTAEELLAELPQLVWPKV